MFLVCRLTHKRPCLPTSQGSAQYLDFTRICTIPRLHKGRHNTSTSQGSVQYLDFTRIGTISSTSQGSAQFGKEELCVYELAPVEVSRHLAMHNHFGVSQHHPSNSFEHYYYHRQKNKSLFLCYTKFLSVRTSVGPWKSRIQTWKHCNMANKYMVRKFSARGVSARVDAVSGSGFIRLSYKRAHFKGRLVRDVLSGTIKKDHAILVIGGWNDVNGGYTADRIRSAIKSFIYLTKHI
jgi:hypothetical protein